VRHHAVICATGRSNSMAVSAKSADAERLIEGRANARKVRFARRGYCAIGRQVDRRLIRPRWSGFTALLKILLGATRDDVAGFP
jgi:hypothetical protein